MFTEPFRDVGFYLDSQSWGTFLSGDRVPIRTGVQPALYPGARQTGLVAKTPHHRLVEPQALVSAVGDELPLEHRLGAAGFVPPCHACPPR